MKSLDAYEHWADTYPPAPHNPVMRAEQRVVEPLIRRLRPRFALDVGTGSGRYLPLLRDAGASVVGIDRSWAMLSRAVGCRVCGDARQLPFRGETFDLVNASLMVCDVADLAGWASEIARVLKPRGHVVYSDFHPSWARYGWRRTFAGADGSQHELPIEWHTIEQHLDALEHAGLCVRLIREPRIGADRVLAAFREQWGDPPVLVVVQAERAS